MINPKYITESEGCLTEHIRLALKGKADSDPVNLCFFQGVI